MKVVVVTDPLCSWCWGMAPAVEVAADRLGDAVTFDLLLGGINTHATQPMGGYGRRLLRRIWDEVAATTGQRFGPGPPEPFCYNSTRPCLALAGLRRATGRPPFGLLHRLQQRFFVEGQDITAISVLAATAGEFGYREAALRRDLEDPALLAALRAEFDGARGYGTQALPSLLIETPGCQGGERRLLAGGYVDAETLEAMVRSA